MRKFFSLLLISIMLVTAAIADGECIFDDYSTTYRVGVTSDEAVTITADELSFVFSGKIKVLSNGKQVTVFVKPYSDYDQRNLIVVILGVSVSRFNEYVNNNTNIRMVGYNSMLEEMSAIPYSIGILNEDEIVMMTDYGIRILRVVR